MSVENFNKFGQMCADDEVVRAKAKEIGLEDIDGLIAYGKELGLEFTVDDLKNVAEGAGLMNEELSEDQLEQVAGGVVTSTVGAVCGVVAAVSGVGAAAAGAVGASASVVSKSTRGW